MSSLRALSLCLLLWGTGALWAADPATANGSTAARGRIVVFGDSITAGYGLQPEQAYPALLQKKIDAANLPFEIVNAGVSGDTTAGGLRRVAWALGPGADVLIVALGGNDGLRGVAPKQTAENLAGIIRQARAQSPGLTVIVAAMQMPGNMGTEFVKEFRELFPHVARENDAALVPFLLEGVGGVADLNQDDLIHPNAEGQERIAENVWAILRPLLEARLAQTR